MMKKLLFSAAVFMMGTVAMFAQFDNIGIVGGSTSVGWTPANAFPMTTTDGVTYKYEGLVITVPGADPGVKFVKDNAWNTSWGGSGFPSGTATTSNGPNIPATNGTWDVTFDISSGAYSFVPTGVEYDEVFLTFGANSIEMLTGDGISYHQEFVTFNEAANVAFSIDDTETGWGSSFPSGTAVADQTISVPANAYNIEFNLDTKEYDFKFLKISLIGTGVFAEDINWTVDLDLTTTNGVNYTLNSFTFPGGPAKLRVNHTWNYPAWGGNDFPSGTGDTAPDSANINITAGTYSVTFDRSTGIYSFGAPTAGTESFAKNAVMVFPNPTQNAWNFNAGNNTISSLQIVDVTGKVVYSAAVNAGQATVNASGFASGMYFARIASGNTTETVRVVKN